MRISDWSSDVCSSDLVSGPALHIANEALADRAWKRDMRERLRQDAARLDALLAAAGIAVAGGTSLFRYVQSPDAQTIFHVLGRNRSEEHTSELQSLMRISYAVFCLKKKKIQKRTQTPHIKKRMQK